MKKGICVFLLLSLAFLLVGCEPEEQKGIKFIEMEEVEDSKYQGYYENNIIILDDYIVCDGEYTIVYNEQSYSSNDLKQIETTLNYVTLFISYNNESYQLNFYKNINVLTKVIFPNNEVLTVELLVGSLYKDTLLNEVLTKADELGYAFDGYVNYAFEGVDYENVLLENLAVLDNIIFYPVLEPLTNTVIVNGNSYSIVTGEVIDIDELNKEGYSLFNFESGFKNGAVYYKSMGTNFETVFIPKTYQVTFNYLSNKQVITQIFDKEIRFPVLIIEGYTFNGWYYNGELFNNDVYNLLYDITLEGDFTPNTYKLIFTNIVDEYEVEVKYDQEFTLPIPEKDGFIFKGWEYNNETFISGKWTYLEDITLKAIWEEKPEDVNLTLEAFGGDVETLASVDGLGNLVLPTPTKENYQFVGWYFDSKLTLRVDTLKVSEYKGETLYSKYKYDKADSAADSAYEFVATRFNAHAGDYSELAIFDSTKSGFTSKYWHKVGVVKTEEGYVVSSIAISGESLSSLGEYDFVILAYSAYNNYNEFVSSNFQIGYDVFFSVDPTTLEDGETTLQISIVSPNVEDDIDEIKEELDALYEGIDIVTSDIDLIDSVKNYTLTWKSSNIKAISNYGKYNKPHVTRSVTLSAYVGETKVYDFSFTVPGVNEVSDALSTGYIYTPYTITQNAMDMLDIIYTAFLEIDYQGNWTNLERMKSNLNLYILPKAKISGTKVVVSINQKSSGNFSNVCKDATLRTKLVDNIIAFMLEMELDGVDIDWETPKESEKENFTLLMKELYEKVKAIDEDLLVTAAIGGGKWAPPCYDLPNSKNYMDYINLMTYSMATSNGYYQNSLYKSTKGATLVSCSIDESIEIYNELGVENSQIIVGIPFYCTKQTASGGPGSKTGSGVSVSYSVMLDEYPVSDTMKEYFDEECGVPYRYDPTTKIMFSYDNERSIELKCDYINTLGLAGIMYWQYGQDVDDMLTNAIKEYINK